MATTIRHARVVTFVHLLIWSQDVHDSQPLLASADCRNLGKEDGGAVEVRVNGTRGFQCLHQRLTCLPIVPSMALFVLSSIRHQDLSKLLRKICPEVVPASKL